MTNSKPNILLRAGQGIIASPVKAVLVLWGVTALVYGAILANGLVLDDNSLLFGWQPIRSLANIYLFFFRFIPPDTLAGVYAPLRVFLLALSLKFFGVSTGSYHLFSVFVHLTAVFLVYLLAHRLTASRAAAFWAGLLFALHPVNSESIAHFTASTEALGMTLGLLSFYLYVRAVGFSRSLLDGKEMELFRPDEDLEEEDDPVFVRMRGLGLWPRPYFFSLVFAAAALFTSGQAVILPVLLLWFDAVFHRTPEPGKIRVCRALPFFAVAGAYLLMKKAALGYFWGPGYPLGGVLPNVIIAFKSCLQYVRFALWPWPLSIRTVLSPGIFSSGAGDFSQAALLRQSLFEPRVLLAASLIGGVIVLSLRARRGRPIFLFCAGWFFLSLLPALSLFPQTVFFSFEKLYFALFPFCLCLAFLFVRGREWLGQQKRRRSAGILSAALGVILFLYAAGTFLNNRSYRNSVWLLSKAVWLTPQIASLHHDLGVILADGGFSERALPQFRKAVELDPAEAQYYFALAEAYAYLGKPDEAVVQLKKAVELEPDFAEAYFNLAALYAQKDDRQNVSKYLTLARESFIKQERYVEAAELLNAFTLSMAAAEAAKAKEESSSQDRQ